MKVLVVDDDKIIRKGLITVLKREFNEFICIEEAPNGQRALDYILNNEVDCIITDIKMPIMDGIQLLKNIKEKCKKIKVIVLSGFDDYKYVRTAMKEGAYDYLLKPIDTIQMITMIKKVFDEINNEINNEKNEKVKDELLKKIVLLEALQGKVDDKNQYKKSINNLNNNNLLVVFSIDNIFKYNKDKMYLEERVKCRLKECDWFNEFIITEYKSNIVVLLNLEDKDTETIEENLKALRSKIDGQEVFTVSIGYTDVEDSLHDILNSFRCIEKTLDKRIFLGNRIMMKGKKEDENYKINTKEVKLLLEKSFDKLLVLQETQVINLLEQLFHVLIDNKVDKNQLVHIFENEINKNLNNEDFKFIVNGLKEKNEDFTFILQNVSYIKDIEYYIKLCMLSTLKKLQNLRMKRESKIIEKAKSFIENNYNTGLSLTVLAEHVHLNPNYFSEIFKVATGQNFIDYLIETRIKKAKKLLEATDLKIYEISELVGYKESISFNRAFKKIVGISPREYKKIIK